MAKASKADVSKATPDVVKATPKISPTKAIEQWLDGTFERPAGTVHSVNGQIVTARCFHGFRMDSRCEQCEREHFGRAIGR